MSNINREKYLFLTSYIRARETKLLTRERLMRMAEAPDFDEAAKLLADCGYPDLTGMSEREIEPVLNRRREDFFRDIERQCPEKAIVECFRLRFDCHNAKALVKAEAAGTDGAGLLSDSGRVSPAALIEAFTEDHWGNVPRAMAQAIRDARAVMARTSDPQLADIGLDKAYYSELLSLTRSLSTGFYTDYVRLSIDISNLRTAVRCLRSRMDPGVLRTALIPGGNVSCDRFAKAAETGITGLFTDRAMSEAAELGQRSAEGAPLAPFELACDNALNSCLAGAKTESYGPAPVIAYLASLEGELVAVRMLLLGKRGGISADTLKERLRDSYV